METLENLKRQIQTAQDLHSLVKTMKALAAVNIRHLEHAVESLADFNRTIELGLRALLKNYPAASRLARAAPQRRLGAVVFGSDQGMCGQLNDQIVSYAIKQMARSGIEPKNRTALAVGLRVGVRLEDAGQAAEATFPVPGSTAGITLSVQDILLRIENWHTERQIDRIVLYYSEHVSRAGYRPCAMRLLPIDRIWLQRLEETPWPTHALPMFTMDADRLFSALLRQYLYVSLYRAFAESLASENASRLASMRGAERNIGDRLGELTSQFHQQRQMTITEELLDIVAGFEALTDDATN